MTQKCVVLSHFAAEAWSHAGIQVTKSADESVNWEHQSVPWPQQENHSQLAASSKFIILRRPYQRTVWSPTEYVRQQIHPLPGHEGTEWGKKVQLYSLFNLGATWGWMINAKRRAPLPPVPIVQEARYTRKPVWTAAEKSPRPHHFPGEGGGTGRPKGMSQEIYTPKPGKPESRARTLSENMHK